MIVSKRRPACVIFVVDQSSAMVEPARVAGLTASRAFFAAESVNRCLFALCRLSESRHGTESCFEVAVITHGGDGSPRPGLESGLTAWPFMGMRSLAALSTAPTTGEVPRWLAPAADGEPAADRAMGLARDWARKWRRVHRRGRAPLVIVIGDPTPPPAGAVATFQCLFDDQDRLGVDCPADAGGLGEGGAVRACFEAAEPIADDLRRNAARSGRRLSPGARGLLLNADLAGRLEALLAPSVRLGSLVDRLTGGGRPRPAPSISDLAWADPAVDDLAPPLDTGRPVRIARAANERYEVRACLIPKAGAANRECEDALAYDLDDGRFCVADGAGEGAFSRPWARTLAMGWSHGRGAEMDDDSLREGVRALDGVLRTRIRRDLERVRARQGGRLLWFQADPKVAEFAAFIGLDIDPSGAWRAVAVGDSCLFVEAEGRFEAFPLSRTEDFAGAAVLVPSAIDRYSLAVDQIARRAGVSRPGARFLLMSDAIACWYIGHPERRERLVDSLCARNSGRLGRIVNSERAARRLRNDDVAILLVVIKV